MIDDKSGAPAGTAPETGILIRRESGLAARYGTWAVVTGASDGIGCAFAHHLGEAGINLVLVARRRPRLEDLAAELGKLHGIEARVLALDLKDPAAVEVIDRATHRLDVGLLVAAAGFGTSGPFVASSLAAEVEMLEVNCRALMELASRFGERLVGRGRGGMVLMSSLVAFQGVPRAAHYAATKAYVQTLAEGLHHELKPHGVDVIASAPGPIRSGFGARAGMQLGRAPGPDVVARETLAALGRRATVRPGVQSKLLELALKTVPRWARVRIMGQVMRGMTRHQDDQTREETCRSA